MMTSIFCKQECLLTYLRLLSSIRKSKKRNILTLGLGYGWFSSWSAWSPVSESHSQENGWRSVLEEAKATKTCKMTSMADTEGTKEIETVGSDEIKN